MNAFLVDTNIIILHVGNIEAVNFETYDISISELSVFELLRYPKLSRHEETAIKTLLNTCTRIPVTSNISQRAAHIARTKQGRGMDFLIAATALELDVPLITKNTKDFRGIPGLLVQETIMQRS
ncbi:MAG: PIN domain-containing protein [Patescibacteria group bacterium]